MESLEDLPQNKNAVIGVITGSLPESNQYGATDGT